jgi:hypothetical protein
MNKKEIIQEALSEFLFQPQCLPVAIPLMADEILKKLEEEKCHWKEDTDGTYETDCGQAYCMNDGTPKENDMRFCSFCGRVLEEVSYDNGWEDEEDEFEIESKAAILKEAKESQQ